jgi:hypothetical protein
MATPLYVRVRQLPTPQDAIEKRRRSLGGLLPRIIRRQSLPKLQESRNWRIRATIGLLSLLGWE